MKIRLLKNCLSISLLESKILNPRQKTSEALSKQGFEIYHFQIDFVYYHEFSLLFLQHIEDKIYKNKRFFLEVFVHFQNNL